MKDKLVTRSFSVGVLLAMAVIVDCACVFQHEKHQLGDTWHPEAFGTCVNCTCRLGDTGTPEVKCVNTEERCPKLVCDHPKKEPHMCCPYCEVSADEDKSNSNARAPCTTSDGRIFQNGDRFASNSTGIRRTKDNQCVMCICEDGQSLCFLKTCPALPPGCTTVIQTVDDCCPICADCMENMMTKTNGSTWHPSIANIGDITCVTCTCLNGHVKCQKDYEPPARKNKPGKKNKPGRKKKPKDKEKKKSQRKGGEKKDNRRRSKCSKDEGEKAFNRCRRRERKNRRRKTAKTSPLTLPSPSSIIDLSTLCINRRRETFLVYKAISQSEMMIAFDNVSSAIVDVFRWAVTKDNQRGVVSFQEPVRVPAEEFRRGIHNTNVMGTTGETQYAKFKARLEQTLLRCREKCDSEMFIKILKRIRLKLLKFGEKC
ncbi:hypothetical protein DPMN_135905 [Dreissena polymorpha]|uniref:VWFC domain-containing protein n=1 Tax=Dreissena polymorpha TaxID=45954 RepID=A0A9D4JDB4_DREPO|nr:hypothetical protein DPMN_135905 [Dreissena polymorpha]